MFSSSLTFFFLALTSLWFPSLAAPAVQKPPSAVQATASPVETFFPMDGSYPLPAPASAEMDRIEDLSPELTAFFFGLKSLPPKVDEQPPSMVINQTTDFNQLENLYCLTEFKVGGAGRLGFMVNYYDRVVNQNQSVAFTAEGPELYLAYRLLRRHTNKDGFYEDMNLFRSPQGLNVGYDPTGKSLNVAGWDAQVTYDGDHQFDKLQAACRDAFGIEADGPSGSFYQKYAGDFVPSILSPEPVQSS